MTLWLQYRRCSLPPMTGSNKAAIVGAHVHVAIVFHDRDKGLLDRRLGGAPGHDDGVWRRLDNCGRAQGKFVAQRNVPKKRPLERIKKKGRCSSLG